MQHLVHDVRFALRLLRRSPGFTVVVILTLALGIGATTAIFSVVNAALLKPLPFADPARLVVPQNGTGLADRTPLSFPQLLDWRDSSGAFQNLAGYFTWNPTLGGTPDAAEEIRGMRSTASLFETLGIKPIRGQLFTAADEARSAAPVVLLSESLWRRKFNLDEHIVGQPIVLNDQTFTIIGVLPASFRQVRPRDGALDVFAPLRLTTQGAPASLHFLSTIARLKPGETPSQAQQHLLAWVWRADPDALPRPQVVVTPLRDGLVLNSKAVLLALLGAVGFLLLITCANLANLLLARAVGRRPEIAVRLALGADRRRVLSQLLTECLILSGAGGAAGILVAWLTVRAVSTMGAIATVGVYDLRVDWAVLTFAAGISLVVGLLFGLVPALQAGKVSLTRDLRSGTRAATGRAGLRSALIVAEVALTLLLLVGAGLLTRSLVKLLSVDKGFAADSALSFSLSTTTARYPKGSDQNRFFDDVVARLSRLPNVVAVGLISEIPLGGSNTNGTVHIEGQTFPPGQDPMPQKRITSPGYFAAMGIPIKQGRVFTTADNSGALPVIVVSEAFARRWFPKGDAVGKRVEFNWDMDGMQTVIGVVADVKHNGLDDPANEAVYVSYAQRPESAFSVVMRTTVEPEALTPSVRDQIRAIDPTRPITNLQTLSALVSSSIGARRLSLELVVGFAVIGLLLAITGIFGVVSYATEQRSREFGIRLALGAGSGLVLRLVLKQGLTMALGGVALGLAGALALGGVVRAQLFGIEPSDPMTLAFVSVGLVGVALLACLLPARRAVRTNPATVLRAD